MGEKDRREEKPSLSDSDDGIPAKENVPPERESGRGREAEKPTEVPSRGWLDILWRTKQQLNADNLSIVAAGVAYYAFLALVPGLAVLIAAYALVANPSDLSKHLDALSRLMPGEVMPLLQQQMTRIAKNNTAAGVSAIVGVLLALYSSSKATKALITGLNIAYNEKEKRGFIKLNAVALALTLCGIIGVLVAFGLVAVVPPLFRHLFHGHGQVLLTWLRWPILVGWFLIGVATIYRFAPARQAPQWKWISSGAGVATALWMIGSALFSYYVSKFGSYEKTYGSLGAVVIFLIWLYLSAYVVLLGAELNSEMERQTKKDTTTGAPKEMGQRGAYSADTLGPPKSKG